MRSLTRMYRSIGAGRNRLHLTAQARRGQQPRHNVYSQSHYHPISDCRWRPRFRVDGTTDRGLVPRQALVFDRTARILPAGSPLLS